MLAAKLNDWVEIQPSEETHDKDLVFRRGQVIALSQFDYAWVQLESAAIALPLEVLKVVDA